MSAFLEDLWIINGSGIVLFTKVEHRDLIKQDFLGALLSSIHQLTEGSLRRFSTKNYQFFILEKQEILFIFQYKRKTDFHEP